MHINVSIGDTVVAMTEANLADLNKVLAETPVVNRYENDKIQETKRIKLEATLIVKTRAFEVLP